MWETVFDQSLVGCQTLGQAEAFDPVEDRPNVLDWSPVCWGSELLG